MRTKTMWIKEEYLQQILDGRKTIEVRVAYDNISRLQVGDHLLLNDQHPYAIHRIGRYANFEAMLAEEDPSAIAPDTPTNELLGKIRAIYPEDKEELGVIALEIEPETKLNVRIIYEYDAEEIAYLQSKIKPGISISIGDETGEVDEFHVLVAGRMENRHLLSSQNLHTVIIPWVGVASETRTLLLDHQHLAVHNLHYNAAPVAEMVIALMLAASKVIIPYDQNFRRHDWTMRYQRPGPSLLIDGKTALVLGYGAIGQRVAAACKALGLEVLALKRTVQNKSDAAADEIHPIGKLHDLLPRANFLLICLPLTPDTENLIREVELGLLPGHSVLVNVGRARIVEQAALYAALRSGRLHSAGLDVWYNYPPDKEARTHTAPADHPFHELANIVMSPHRAGDTRDSDHLRMVHLAKLLNCILEDKPAPDKVDITLGY